MTLRLLGFKPSLKYLRQNSITSAIFFGESSASGYRWTKLVFGILSFSSFVCLYTSVLKDDMTCKSPLCLYCFRSLSRTIFKDLSRVVIPSEKRLKVIWLCAIYAASAILTSLLYYFTVIFISIAIHIVADTVKNVVETGRAFVRIVPSPSLPKFSPWKQHMPSSKELRWRLLQKEISENQRDVNQK